MHTPITGVTYSSCSMSTLLKVFCWTGHCLQEWLTFEEQNILTLPLDKNNSTPNTTWQLWLSKLVVRLNNSQCKVNMNILSLSQSDWANMKLSSYLQHVWGNNSIHSDCVLLYNWLRREVQPWMSTAISKTWWTLCHSLGCNLALSKLVVLRMPQKYFDLPCNAIWKVLDWLHFSPWQRS